MRLTWASQTLDIREAGAGAAVVLVHGYPLDGAMWSGAARLLGERFRVVKLDLPGRAGTPASDRGGMEGYADFLEAVLAELPEPVGIAGFSMGGYATLALMKRRPAKVRALALVDTRATPDDAAGKAKRDESVEKVRSEGVAPIAAAMVEKLLSPASAAKSELVERVRRIIMRQSPETIIADLQAMRDREDSSSLLGEIAIPTLVLVGEQDVLTPPADARAMADAIPGARLVTIPEAGHLTPMEQPKAVGRDLSDFFTSALA